MTRIVAGVVVAALAVALFADCGSRKASIPHPAESGSPSPPSPDAAYAKLETVPTIDAAEPPRTELDRRPAFVASDERSTLQGGAYRFACSLYGLESAKLEIGKDHRVALLDGARTVASLRLRDDFYSADTEVSCAKRFITLRLAGDDDKVREANVLWVHGRLVESGRGLGDSKPMLGP